MHYFFSVGEPSGDLHASHLIEELRALDPASLFHGFGGPKMSRAGCGLLYPLVDHPVMHLMEALRGLSHFRRLVEQGERFLKRRRPDAVVLIDYPGFNWHLARRAKALGIPVFYYIPPQIWAWACWRVRKMRRFVDHVLCSLPFEAPWYHQHGVRQARYVGHPFFDDLAQQRFDNDFIAHQRRHDDRRIVALLPGSRDREVRRNIATMIRAAGKIAQAVPDLRFLVAAFKESQTPWIRSGVQAAGLPIEIHVDKTPEIMKLASASITVSGSVSLELMYHRVPTVIQYQIGPIDHHVLVPLLGRTPFITLVNLLANQAVMPEYLTCRDESTAVAGHVIGWLRDESARQQLVIQLGDLTAKFGQPGAAHRAAEHITRTLMVRQLSVA